MKQLFISVVIGGAFLILSPGQADAQVCYPRVYSSYAPVYRAYRPVYRAPIYRAPVYRAPVYRGYAYRVPAYQPYPSAVWHPRSSVYLGPQRNYGYYPPSIYSARSYGYGGTRYRLSIGF